MPKAERGSGAPSPDSGSSPPSLRDTATGTEGRSSGTYAQVSGGSGHFISRREPVIAAAGGLVRFFGYSGGDTRYIVYCPERDEPFYSRFMAHDWVERWAWSFEVDRAEPAESIFEPAVAWGFALRDADDYDTWLFLDDRTVDTANEAERSPYSGCVYDCRGEPSQAAWIEHRAASLWVNTAIGDDRKWVWP